MNELFLESLIKMFPEVPFQKLLGIEIVEVVAERALVCLPFRDELTGGNNTFHGGAISSLLDLTGALAAWSGHNTENGMRAATVSMTVNYLAAAQGKDIIATANAVKRGRELIFSEVSICEKESGKLVANGSMIYRIT
ncbi:MAG: PaaI family thioesterase [Moraxellaceae bacterium]|jgi:uncharacterized protein (TIGR00369 family)|nr:PaaI family thioesterase [Moraxellaceae bacterium]MDZ4298244.1 PaaI family thioesterase [Moraxellaceae bacterium]MDZ4387443.1 PaaI family thioesterase [Moraxellaceae bacterium]